MFGAETNGLPVSSAIRRAAAVAEARVGVQPGPDRRAADRQLAHARPRPYEPVERLVELRDPAGDHLAQGQGRRVLEVRPAHHDHMGKRLRLGVQRVPQGADRGEQQALQLFDGGNVHHGGEGVVGRLAVVDVVVGVDRLLRPDHPAGELDGAVGDDLVGVHVGLRARPGLEHDQRELTVELAVDDLLGGPDDQVDLVGAVAGPARRWPGPRIS